MSIADGKVCQWVSWPDALENFATYAGKTQSQEHIKPFHWYIACRLVLEGGFHPDNITPRPPFNVVSKGDKHYLHYAVTSAGGSELSILGGLKTKKVDIVVTKDGIGPVMAVSCKGMTGALRNLTNRMEETIGECTNLHITYPAMVFGYFFVLAAHRTFDASMSSEVDENSPRANDIGLTKEGLPVPAVRRFYSALSELTGRHGIRNDFSRYEAITLALIESREGAAGVLLADFPPNDSPLNFKRFFSTLYQRYEERYVYGAPDLKSITQRLEWAPESPVFDRS